MIHARGLMSLNVSSLLLGCIDEKIRVVEDTPGVEAFMRISARALITLAAHVVLLFSSLCLLLRHLCQAVSKYTLCTPKNSRKNERH